MWDEKQDIDTFRAGDNKGGRSSSKLPTGIPCQCVVRIRSPPSFKGKQVVLTDGKFIKIGSRKDEVFAFKGYDIGSSNFEIFQNELKPLIRKYCEGFSVGVLTFGRSSSGKIYTLVGDLESKFGLVQYAVKETFELLSSKINNNINSRVSTQSSFSIRAQYFEIYNDTIHDLFFSSKSKELFIEYGEYGVFVSGLKSIDIRRPEDLNDLIRRSQSMKTTELSDFGPMQDRSSTFLILDLEQKVAPSFEVIHSRLTFICLPGAEKLAEDPDIIRAREGPRLNRELLAFSSLVKKLSNESSIDFADYGISQTTSLLDDVLGGNCITLCISTLLADDRDVSKFTLEHSLYINRIINYPLVNNENSIGMLRKLRLQIQSLKQELRNFVSETNRWEGSKGMGVQNSDVVVVDLKSKLVSSELDRGRLLKEKEQLLKQFSDFRTKYTDIIKSKSELQTQIIKSEEERIRVSKLLIDLQIENTDLKEHALTEKYELEAKLLASENQIVERESQEHNFKEENDSLKKKLQEAQNEIKDISVEYVTLRQNHENLVEDMKLKEEKIEEVGVELLSLVNQNKVLEDKNKEMEASLQKLEKNASDNQIKNVKEANTRLSTENETLKLELIRKDIELKKVQSEYNGKKAELDRLNFEMESESEQQKRVIQNQLDLKVAELKGKSEEIEKLESSHKIEIKAFQRKLEEMETKIIEQGLENSELIAQGNNLQRKLADERESYREKLISYMKEMQNVDSEDPENDESERQQPNIKIKAKIEGMYRSLLNDFRSKEFDWMEKTKKIESKLFRAIRKNRELFVRYKSLRSFVQDISPSNTTIALLGDEELASLNEKNNDEEIESMQETERLEDTINSLKLELDNQKQLQLSQIEDYSHQISQLNAEISHFKDEYERIKKVHSSCDKSLNVDVLEEHQNSLKEFQSFLEQKFCEQLDNLKNSKVGHTGSLNKEQLYSLKDQIEVLKKENQNLRDQLLSGHSGSPNNDGMNEMSSSKERSYKEQINKLHKRIIELESYKGKNGDVNGYKDVNKLKKEMKEFQINTQRELERERVTLKTRARQAEEQLKHFEEYMKDESLNYQKEILALRESVSFCSKHHGGMNIDNYPVKAWPHPPTKTT